LGFLSSLDNLQANAGRICQVAPDHLGPRCLGKRRARRQPLVQDQDRHPQPGVWFLTEAFTERQAEDKYKENGHDQEDDRRLRIAKQQPEFFLGEDPDEHGLGP
jgi:hypothetical protein